ncbi:MAG: M20/M25/M40 family metallo-hydrolase [Saprospiraceae bacterium]|nr:M20/M25/M40 family metallo-hydrolase [Saprospiraceae bacterium]
MNKIAFTPKLVRICCLSLISIFTLSGVSAQTPAMEQDAVTVDKIFDQALTNGRCYPWLERLCFDVGHRLSGSPAAEKAVLWAKSVLDTLPLDSVWLQPCMVPHWVRGQAEEVRMLGKTKKEFVPLAALALGGSVGTSPGGIQAEVVEVKSWEALDQLGERNIRGKIVFYNRPMDPTKIRTFEAYGGCVDQRVSGASKAAKYGAVAVLVRSMTLRLDDFPHTGSLRYDSAFTLIPAAAISTQAAELLSKTIKEQKTVQVSIKMNCQMLADAPSNNVIGEIRGSQYPNTYITVGGHLDSWDVGHGAHDDGAGVVQSFDALRLLQQIGYQPRHSIRCVAFMNEENGLRGGKAYADEAKRKRETHLFAIESDAGGFTPRGFSFESEHHSFEKIYEKIKSMESLFTPYGLVFAKGGSGADISPLRPFKAVLSGYAPDSQRYFDYHHTADDTFDKVNKRELELGAACMAALIYLVDKYGME